MIYNYKWENGLYEGFMYSIISTAVCFKMEYIDHIYVFMVETRIENHNMPTKLDVNWNNVTTTIMLH